MRDIHFQTFEAKLRRVQIDGGCVSCKNLTHQGEVLILLTSEPGAKKKAVAPDWLQPHFKVRRVLG
jgi:hypothetical protein